MEREFDRMIKKATPYLIFSPNNVRDVIADYMKSLWRAMRTNNTNDFDTLCTNINHVIATSDDLIDGTLQIDISDFDGRWSNLDESISNLRTELRDLKKEVSNINKDVSVKEKVSMEVMAKEKPAADNLAETKPAESNLEESKPLEKQNPKICLCGKNLKRSRNNNGTYTYHCYKSRSGCGKIYYTGDGGQLIEKTSVKQNKIFCISCGGILNRQGKVKSNGKEYQIYSCKPSTNGGCGKGYVMDDDGDLHIGRRESALSTPKVFARQGF